MFSLAVLHREVSCRAAPQELVRIQLSCSKTVNACCQWGLNAGPLGDGHPPNHCTNLLSTSDLKEQVLNSPRGV